MGENSGTAGLTIERAGVVSETDPPDTTPPFRKYAASERQYGRPGASPETVAGIEDTTTARTGVAQVGPTLTT
jgi:hypothetical protein